VKKHVRTYAALLGAWVAAARPAVGQRRLAIEPPPKQVKRCERIELTIQTDASPANPYDPGEIDLRIELTGPAGKKLTVPAFYYQHHEGQHRPHGGRKTDWVYPVGKGVWKARFSPTEVGRWSCGAALKSRGGSAESPPVSFRCVNSASKGYVRVSPKNGRYLALGDGTPFFPVGQNVAFVKDSHQSAEMLRKLGEHGANFARIWACCEDWAMAVEARKSGWGRSWSWEPPILHMPTRRGFHSDDRCVGIRGKADTTLAFSPTRPLALRPNTKYRLSGQARTDTGVGFTLELSGPGKPRVLKGSKRWTPFSHEFTTSQTQWWLGRLTFRSIAACTMYLKDLSLTEAAGGPELLAEADVNRPLIGFYNQLDCFLLDKLVETAEQCGVYLQLVMLTRDHYMPLLRKDNTRDYDRAIEYGKRLVRYFVARWGYSTHVAAWEYFNEMNPGLPTERFYRELGEYLRRIDVNRHLRANSAWASPSKDYRHPELDTADIHWYMRPAAGELWKDAAAGVLSRARLARKHAPSKPVLLSEFGMTDNQWRRPGELDRDKEFVHLHNGLWASALSGLASTVCHWYWDDVHAKDMYHHYRPIAAFVADIPFTTADLRAASAACGEKLRVVGLQADSSAYLWISDPNATWWKLSVERAGPAETKGASLEVTGLKAGAYRVEWWDTWKGQVIRRDAARASKDALRLAVPAFSRDIACKITGRGP